MSFQDKNLCCGCKACLNICPVNAIIFKEDNEGFEYPIIDESKCIKCNLCKKVCNFLKEKDINNYKKVIYAAKHKDLEIRKSSTSGGMFTALFDYFIKNGGIVYGCSMDENLNACHVRCTTVEECNKCKGSKYIQSDLKNIYSLLERDLKDDKLVLFVGSACQIESVKLYLKIKKVNDENLFLCDFICHGVPSKKIFKEYIHFLEKKYNKKIKSYHFRTKNKGWIGHNEEAIFVDNSVLNSGKDIRIYKELYGTLCTIRPSCYNCHYANDNHNSDITIGDFWGIDNYEKDFFDNYGVSFVMINSSKGAKIFNEIKIDLVYIISDIKKCKNPQLISPTVEPKKRNDFWKQYNKKGFKFIAKKYTTYGVIKNVKVKLYPYIKNILKK